VAADTAALAIAARIWPGAAVTLEELSGGLTNLNYKATTPSGTFVIRLFGRDAGLLAIDRETEQAATSMAARLGIGPEVVACAPREGYLVTRFLPGQQLTAEQMRAPGVMAQVAATLRVLHQGPPIPGTLDPFAIAGRIKRAVSFSLTAPCHGDLLPANFIGYGGQIFLVDWEYAGMSDPRFDLANFSVNHDFGTDEDRELVRLYHGNPDEHIIAAVRVLRFMSAFREAMWSVVQQAISDLPFDFREYAGEQFARMRAAASGQEFGAALALLESATG